MALYRALRVFEQVFNLENYLDVNALQSFIGYAKLSASNVFERFNVSIRSYCCR